MPRFSIRDPYFVVVVCLSLPVIGMARLLDPIKMISAIPLGLMGVLRIPALACSALNVMSLMDVLMPTGIADSSRVLIAGFAHQYAPMARAMIDGLISSVLFTIFIVLAAYVRVYRSRRRVRLAPANTPVNA